MSIPICETITRHLPSDERMDTMTVVPINGEVLRETATIIRRYEETLEQLEAEARRFAAFYPEASDGRNTFVIFADKIALSRAQVQP